MTCVFICIFSSPSVLPFSQYFMCTYQPVPFHPNLPSFSNLNWPFTTTCDSHYQLSFIFTWPPSSHILLHSLQYFICIPPFLSALHPQLSFSIPIWPPSSYMLLHSILSWTLICTYSSIPLYPSSSYALIHPHRPVFILISPYSSSSGLHSSVFNIRFPGPPTPLIFYFYPLQYILSSISARIFYIIFWATLM